ncbi:MAG: aspartate aminotransferase family protein [Bacteroidales bacterium]|nr:aspartate aminotransferase family protein [Bacteroidales bacterium]
MLNPKDFKKEAGPVVDWIDHYMNNIRSLPVKSKVSPGDIYKAIPEEAPLHPESMEQIMEDLDRIILPGMTHWQHPGFHAYFPANSSVESVLAESVTAAMGAQCMIWETSPAAAELEQRMMEWLRDAMGIPESFEGVIQDSASSASLVSLITAREVATGFRSNEEGVPQNLRIYCSQETHSSIEKGVGVCGIGRKNLVKIGVDRQMRMESSMLETRIREDLDAGLKPCAVVAAIGTTSTVAVDPLEEIAAICKKYGIWLHVDAAFAGTALLLPEYRWMIKGIEQADSFVFNPHKWMFTNFDCDCFYVADRSALINTFSVLPEYLRNKETDAGTVIDYRDWHVQLGRRFRPLKLWFVIRHYGLEGLQYHIRQHVKLAQEFASWVADDPDFELASPAPLNLVCFRHRAGDEINQQIMEQINRSGEAYLTHTKLDDQFTLRLCVGQTYTEARHVSQVWNLIKQTADTLTTM